MGSESSPDVCAHALRICVCLCVFVCTIVTLAIFAIKKKLSARSERVKVRAAMQNTGDLSCWPSLRRSLIRSHPLPRCAQSVDFHPSEPWILSALYSGHVFIWNYATQAVVKSAVICDLPVRCARFIPQRQWIVCGADDMLIRVYNYNTMERVFMFEAHTDYIRALAVHPTLPLMLSSSDDMLIKLWSFEHAQVGGAWDCVQTFEGHTHYVMQVEFNPKDTNTFASASLDRTVKVWGLNSPTPHFSLDGHERGVNAISYFRGGDRPYLVSGADDHKVRVWSVPFAQQQHTDCKQSLVTVTDAHFFSFSLLVCLLQGLSNEGLCRHVGWSHQQHFLRFIPPSTAHYSLWFRGRNGAYLAFSNVPFRKHIELRDGTCMDCVLFKGK